VARAARPAIQLAFFDINDFKSINDRHGHSAGGASPTSRRYCSSTRAAALGGALGRRRVRGGIAPQPGARWDRGIVKAMHRAPAISLAWSCASR
jgi:hypothetical protein